MALPTLAQLRAEPYWGREVVTAELRGVGARLVAATGQPPSAFGAKGSVGHLYGGHRSQEWLKKSRWCVNRDYTTRAGLSATQLRHVAALDWTPGVWGAAENRRRVVTLTERLVAAGTGGRLDGVTEVLGSLDGRQPIGVVIPEGWTFQPDYSHLDHIHVTMDRRRMRDQAVMDRIVAAMLGTGDDVSEADVIAALKSEAGQAAISAAVLNLFTLGARRDGSAGKALSDAFHTLGSNVRLIPEAWAEVVGHDGAVPAPENWPDPANPAMALGNAIKELLARAVTGEGALAELVALIRAGGGNPDVAALAAKVAALTESVEGLQATTVTLGEAVVRLATGQSDLEDRLAAAFRGDR